MRWPGADKQLWMILSVKSGAAVRLIARENRTLTRTGC